MLNSTGWTCTSNIVPWYATGSHHAYFRSTSNTSSYRRQRCAWKQILLCLHCDWTGPMHTRRYAIRQPRSVQMRDSSSTIAATNVTQSVGSMHYRCLGISISKCDQPVIFSFTPPASAVYPHSFVPHSFHIATMYFSVTLIAALASGALALPGGYGDKAPIYDAPATSCTEEQAKQTYPPSKDTYVVPPPKNTYPAEYPTHSAYSPPSKETYPAVYPDHGDDYPESKPVYNPGQPRPTYPLSSTISTVSTVLYAQK